MSAKMILRLFTILSICLIASTCASTTGPEDDVNSPEDKRVSVQYIRQPPIDYDSWDICTLNWSYFGYVAAAEMSKISEDNFSWGAQIRTETEIFMNVGDQRKGYPGTYVRKRLFIDGHELIFAGSVEGSVQFIYHNDGSIEITSPK